MDEAGDGGERATGEKSEERRARMSVSPSFQNTENGRMRTVPRPTLHLCPRHLAAPRRSHFSALGGPVSREGAR